MGRALLLLGIFGLGSACASASRVPVWELWAQTGELSSMSETSSAAASLHGEGLARWAERDRRPALEAAISTWERAIAQAPDHAPSLLALARAQHFLGDAFLSVDEGVDEEEEAAVYEKGVTYAERALLALEPEFASAISRGQTFDEALTKIGPSGVAAAYWYAANLGRFSAVLGVRTRSYYRERLKKVIKAVHKIEPVFHYGGADRFLGAYFAELSTPEGKDLTASAEHFQQAVELGPRFLLNKVDQARFLAVELSDEALFKRLLNEVLNAPEGLDPDLAPENRAAKRQAKQMLKALQLVF